MAKSKPLPLERLAEQYFLNDDGKLCYARDWDRRRWGFVKAGERVRFSYDTNGYPRVSLDGRLYLAYRLVYALYHGRDPHPQQIDHIDGNPSNVTVSNLRLADFSTNQHNSLKCQSSCGVQGVTHRASRGDVYEACIKHKGVTTYLGRYATAEEAHAVYVAAKNALAGSYSPYQRGG